MYSYLDEIQKQHWRDIYRDIVKPWLIFLAGIGAGIIVCGIGV